jgi:hypothetical protein
MAEEWNEKWKREDREPPPLTEPGEAGSPAPAPLEPAVPNIAAPDIAAPDILAPDHSVSESSAYGPPVSGPVLEGNARSSMSAHLRTAGNAVLNWWRAASIQALCDAVLWLIGLLLLHVPLAPAWALVAGLMAFVPNIGGVIALIGPTLSILFTGKDLERLAFLLGLYACIVVIDQLLLQPWLMKRTARVPVWASIVVPIVLGIVIPFWGVLLAPPLLAIVYAFRKPKRRPS